MKSRRVVLTQWFPQEGEYIDIDWPKVQKTIGVDHLAWLLKQPKDQCQLVLDKSQSKVKLVAEFYSESLAVNYHLLWAK
jgi:hypothetical protein